MCESLHLPWSQWKILIVFSWGRSPKDIALLKLYVNSLYYLEQKYHSFTQDDTRSKWHGPIASWGHRNPTHQNHPLQQGTTSTSQPFFCHNNCSHEMSLPYSKKKVFNNDPCSIISGKARFQLSLYLLMKITTWWDVWIPEVMQQCHKCIAIGHSFQSSRPDSRGHHHIFPHTPTVYYI